MSRAGVIRNTDSLTSPAATGLQDPTRRLTLRANFCWTFAGNATNAVCMWALLSVMAKLGSVEMVGTFSWALAIATPVVTLAMLQLRALLLTECLDPLETFGDYLGLRLVGMALAVAGVAFYGLVAGMSAGAFLVVLLVVGSRAIDAVSDIYRGLFQKYERMDLSSWSMIVRGVAALLTVSVALAAGQTLQIALLAMCSVWLMMTLLYEIPRARQLTGPGGTSRLRARLRWGPAKRILPSAMAMGLVLALIALQTSIPRFFLEAWHGREAVGFFSAVLYPLTAGTLVVTALGQSALPKLTRLRTEDRPAYYRLIGKLLVLAVLLGLALFAAAALLGRPLLKIAYTDEFTGYDRELTIMAGGTAFLFVGSFLGFALTAARQYYIQPLIAIVSCVAGIITCYFWVPRYGVEGASWAYSTTVAVSAFVAAACLLRSFRNGPPSEQQP